MYKILVINGPNLNMLGVRNPSVYGIETLNDINQELSTTAEMQNINIEFFQSNSEGEIVSAIQNALGAYDGLIINPGAYSHYSIAIRDAIEDVSIPAIEVHISNIHKREEFRRHTVTSEVCIGQIAGLGYYGYICALMALNHYLKGV
jgi:3-dehydroquinate dehydratase-2